MLVRSPMFTNSESSVMLRGSSPDSRVAMSMLGTSLGFTPSTTLAISAIWAGAVPQHPPTRLTRPASANSAR
ncbi:Uncharacterised protein [Mycobacteroides abscessus subsp. abscessus]|nr:Uncharacterised protein [Mycobacteroides abscessus subsp. abscessus]